MGMVQHAVAAVNFHLHDKIQDLVENRVSLVELVLGFSCDALYGPRMH